MLSKRSLQLAAMLALTTTAQAQNTPIVMETLGIKIGDTPAQIDKVLVGQGYKLVVKDDYAAGFGLPARPQYRDYQKQVEKAGSLPKEYGYVKIGFGPKSSTAVAIARREAFDKPVSRGEMEKALRAKYGPTTSDPKSTSGALDWIAFAPNPNKVSFSPDRCKARMGEQVNYGSDYKQLAFCKQTLSVILSESSNSGVEIQKIQVNMVDFATYNSEGSALAALAEQKRQDEIEKRKQLPVPKL
jgi:hypothetical protein